MAQLWKTVRIFISSTFRDMHAERDHLVRLVFPELRQRCARRRLHLADVDLRWGVTEEETRQGKVLEICLDEIERCRPFLNLTGALSLSTRLAALNDESNILEDSVRSFATLGSHNSRHQQSGISCTIRL